MSELLAGLVRFVQGLLFLSIVLALAWPQIVAILPLLIPIVVVGLIICLNNSLSAYATRVEEAKSKL